MKIDNGISRIAEYSNHIYSNGIENNKFSDIVSEISRKNVSGEEVSNISSSKGTQADFNVKCVETDKYIISGKEGGYLRIENKSNGEGFNWKLDKNKIQVDSASGLKFLINDLGAGFFNMVPVDDVLESALKEALDVDRLDEKDLEHFTVHQDEKTGINYITANGYESQGGQIILDDAARIKLNGLAETYVRQYPQMIHSLDEAWFYASFEVRGIAHRTGNGIMMMGPNSLSFKDKSGEESWTATFNPSDWGSIKNRYNESKMEKSWNRWYELLKKAGISANLILPD